MNLSREFEARGNLFADFEISDRFLGNCYLQVLRIFIEIESHFNHHFFEIFVSIVDFNELFYSSFDEKEKTN
jgi:hypothetical protein